MLYQYEIIDILGSGTFGKVVRAYDHKYKTHTALKIIKSRSNFR
jgi:serine/threonine protein kinase